MSQQRHVQGQLVTCFGGLSLDGMIQGQLFQLQVKNNPKGTNTASRCNVRIKSYQYAATVVDVEVELTEFTEDSTAVHDDILQLAAGKYAIEARYYDKITHLSYDKYFLNFTVHSPR